MRCFILLLLCTCRQLVGGETKPGSFSFNNNYTFRVFHNYNYEFKQPIQSTNGEFVAQPGIPQTNYPFIPKTIQEELNRQEAFGTSAQDVPEKFRIFQGDTPIGQNVRYVENTPDSFGSTVQRHSPTLPQLTQALFPQNGINPARKSRQDGNIAKIGKLPTTFVVNGTECAFDFCEQAVNYPDQIILKLVEGDQSLSAFFKHKDPVIENRFTPNFENICEVEKKIVAPKTAKNTDGTNRIVVNVNNYKQIVESEVCKTDSTCKFHNYWPEGYAAKCIQKFVEVPLAVMDDKDNKIIIEKFSYPSGCYCACKSE